MNLVLSALVCLEVPASLSLTTLSLVLGSKSEKVVTEADRRSATSYLL